ncbi:MAG: tRNA (adenosine(37)-N6)-dimethylallyltransferase MiaA [Pseudomonadota bacterium]
MAAVKAVLIAGPTASGKSALAVDLAKRFGGRVINADSQQIYREWHVLTARPSAEEEAAAPHLLYGHVSLTETYSVGHWLTEIGPILDGPLPVIVGGTGLYFKALTEGLAPIPPVPDDVRAAGEAELARIGLTRFAEELSAQDPDTVAGLDMANPRRVLRAWEVLTATGTGLAEWKTRTPAPLLPLQDVAPIALTPPRDWLYARCNARFDQMIANGALDEAREVAAMDAPPASPGLRAVGASPLFDHLADRLSLEDAAQKAKMDTRRYAKRQMTWLRNQMGAWRALDPTDAGAIETAIAMIEA